MQNDAAPPDALIALHWLDWMVVGLYGVVTFGIAFWAMRRIRDAGGLLVGSRRVGKWMTAAAAFAGGTNANHPMSVASATYQNGMPGVWLSLTWMLITPFFWIFPPLLRRLRIVTMVDVVRMRFGRFMSMLFKIIGVIGGPIAMGLGIKSAALVLQVMTGNAIDPFWAQMLIAVPTLIYSLMGGVIAAYATDVFQGILIIVLSFLLIPFAISHAGGLAPLDAAIDDSLTSLWAAESAGAFGPWWIFWFMIGITFSAVLSAGAGAAAAKDEITARMKLFGLVAKRFCTVGWGLAGLFGMALFAGHPQLDPASGLTNAGPDNVFPLAAGELLPIMLRGLMVASILAAVMSSLDAGVIGFGGIVVNNFYQEHFVKNASASHYLLMTRVFAAVGLFFGWLVSTNIKSLVDFTTYVEPFNGLTGIAILVALMWRRTTAAGAIASVVVMLPLFFIGNRWDLHEGVVSLPWGIEHVVQWMHGLYAAIGTHIEIPVGPDAHLPVELKYPLYIVPGLLTLVLVSLLTRQHDQRAVDAFYARLDTPVGDEVKLKEAGFEVDQLEHLDEEELVFEHRDSNSAQRLLMADLLYLPGMLRRGEVRIGQYKWDLIGVAGSVAFVILFLIGVEALGSIF